MTMSSRQRRMIDMLKAGEEIPVIMQFTGFHRDVIEKYQAELKAGRLLDDGKPEENDMSDLQGGLW